MFTNIILTILVIVLITITTLLILWWRKFGREILSLIKDLKNFSNKKQNVNFDGIGKDFNDVISSMKNINDIFRNIK